MTEERKPIGVVVSDVHASMSQSMLLERLRESMDHAIILPGDVIDTTDPTAETLARREAIAKALDDALPDPLFAVMNQMQQQIDAGELDPLHPAVIRMRHLHHVRYSSHSSKSNLAAQVMMYELQQSMAKYPEEWERMGGARELAKLSSPEVSAYDLDRIQSYQEARTYTSPTAHPFGNRKERRKAKALKRKRKW